MTKGEALLAGWALLVLALVVLWTLVARGGGGG